MCAVRVRRAIAWYQKVSLAHEVSGVPTTNEKKALWFLALVALSGSGVRLWRVGAPQATGAESAALEHQIDRVDSVRALRHTKQPARASRGMSPAQRPELSNPVAPVALVDLDRATTEELEALPGIGPALSKRIVAARDSVGGFGQIEALCEVNGIGPALVEKLRPLVTFTGARRPLSDACGGPQKKVRKSRVVRSREPR